MKDIDADLQGDPKSSETLAVATIVPERTDLERTAQAPLTPQQARAVEVTEALVPAYQKASTLELTDAEIAALRAPFPDECVELRPHDGLCYIPHILVSERLNDVFKPGKWALIRRREWLEGGTMYAEYVLVIRGCYVGESIGGHPYIANNPKVNYSDTLESTAAEALRRIAGKRLGCGCQVWNPEYCRQWEAKYKGWSNEGGKRTAFKKTGKPPPAPAAPKAAAPAPAKPEPKATVATDKTRQWFISQMPEAGREVAKDYFIDLGWLMPNETLAELGLRYVPTTKAQLAAVIAQVEDFAANGLSVQPYPPNEAAPINEPAKPIEVPRDPPGSSAPDEWFMKVIVPVPHKGQKRDEYLKNPDTIGSLYENRHNDEDARHRLFGFVNNFQPKGWVKQNGDKMPPSKADEDFRKALDAFADWFQKTHPEERL